MKNNDIVCKCNNVKVSDVLDFVKKHQDTKKEIFDYLRIGKNCGCCLNNPKCPKIDVKITDIINI